MEEMVAASDHCLPARPRQRQPQPAGVSALISRRHVAEVHAHEIQGFSSLPSSGPAPGIEESRGRAQPRVQVQVDRLFVPPDVPGTIRLVELEGNPLVPGHFKQGVPADSVR
jgi:hypothetical protein